MKLDSLSTTMLPTTLKHKAAISKNPQSSRIALYCGAAHPEFTLKILKGVSSQLSKLNPSWRISLQNLLPSSPSIIPIPTDNIDGIIAINLSTKCLTYLNGLHVPIVSLKSKPCLEPNLVNITPNDASIGKMAADYLNDHNYSQLAFFGNSLCPVSERRRQSFEKYLVKAGRKSFCYSHQISSYERDRPISVSLANWLLSLPRPTGIFAANDRFAEVLLKAALALGLQVPNEFKILGVNNESARCNLSNPTLSSINLDYRVWGRQAIEILSGILDGKIIPEDTIAIEPVEVVERDSTKRLDAKDDQVARAIKLIHERASEGLTVKEIANALEISRSNLEHRFRRQTGRSPQTEIRVTKLKKVKRLLRCTTLTINEIADKSGFENPEYLYVAFKKSYGTTPTQYRNRVVTQSRY